MNLSGLRVPTDLRSAAVSSTSGESWLTMSTNEVYDHGAFLGSSSQAGLPVRVETIDQLQLDPTATVALKVDVEGEELRVLQGASMTLRECRRPITSPSGSSRSHGDRSMRMPSVAAQLWGPTLGRLL
jgi:FkbM family methyltransferase